MVMQEQWRVITRALETDKRLPLRDLAILEIGLRGESDFARLISLGATPKLVQKVSLTLDSSEQTHGPGPTVSYGVRTARKLEFPDGTFDLVFLSAIISSILDDQTRRAIAGEVERVLKPGGAILWYDLRRWTPGDQSARPVSRRELRRLFPSLIPSLQAITLMPALARRLKRSTRAIYPLLAAIPLLRSHLVGLLVKPVGDAPHGSRRH